MRAKMRCPAPLGPGDKIAIVAPATEVKAEYVVGAADFLRSRGFEPVIFPGCTGCVSGTFAADEGRRLNDLLTALSTPEIRAILCARGGYGCVHLIDSIPGAVIAADPKWLIGFSDVSALHAMMHRHGVMSLHAGMAKHLTEAPAGDFSVETFLDILGGAREITYRLPESYESRRIFNGYAEGELRGGNLAVLDGLAATPFDILHIDDDEHVILFIEDVGEAIYKVERMLWRLHLSGDLHRAKGLIFCSFNDYRPDKNHPDMEAMIVKNLHRFGVNVPTLLRFPAGHEEGRNLPLIEGCHASLSLTPGGITLHQSLTNCPSAHRP